MLYRSLILLACMFIPFNLKPQPRVSLITSVYDGDMFIEQFLEDMCEQTIFADSELILINPASPGNEEKIIKEYLNRYPNIRYCKLDKDPGLYGVWNIGIKMAQADILANANLDDRRTRGSLEQQVRELEQNPEVDLVYGNYALCYEPNKRFDDSSYKDFVITEEFSTHGSFKCFEGPQPVWRKSLHEQYGYFNEDFKIVGDLEMWCRAISGGSLFKKIDVMTGVAYYNPQGLSTSSNEMRKQRLVHENELVCKMYGYLWKNLHLTPRLLIKLPTRSRPEQFFRTLTSYYHHLSGQIPYHFLITCDIDDLTMNNEQVRQRLKLFPCLTVSYHPHTTKVDAYNHDIADQSFDILFAAADDLEPVQEGFDAFMTSIMQINFPDFSGVLNFNDGMVGARCNTYPIVGKQYYDTCGYLYHPQYKSLFANEELTIQSHALGKELFLNQVLCVHNHPVWGRGVWDNLYTVNESYKEADRKTFLRRKLCGFPTSVGPKLWSILILTLIEREEQFNRLYSELTRQIHEAGLEHAIEILSFKDCREHTVGYKRNILLQQSCGTYVSFIDDDDMVHQNYISMIYQKLLENPDCVMLKGIVTFNGSDPKPFIHSIAYNNQYYEDEHAYYRPPNHLNPIKRSIALQVLFHEINFGEDRTWCMDLSRRGLIKTEASIDEPYYFYNYTQK